MQAVVARGAVYLAAACALFYGQAIAKTIQQMEGVTKKAPSLRAFLSDPALIEEYRKAVEAYYGTSRFNCQNFTEVISELRALSKRVPAVAETLWRPWDYKNSIVVLTSDGHIYNFRAIPRKLHTLWSYSSENYCENEICTNLFVEKRDSGTVLLGRWATTIAGSQVQLIEKDGRYSGMALLLTPYKRDGKVFGLVDGYGDRKALTESVKVLHSRSGKPLETSLLNAWLEKTSTVKPSWLAGFIVPAISSSEKGVSLAQAFEPRKLRPGLGDGFLPVDPLARTISRHLATQCGISEVASVSLQPAVSNVITGGLFEVAVNGDGSFAKGIGNFGGAGFDLFNGEVTPGLFPKGDAPQGLPNKNNFASPSNVPGLGNVVTGNGQGGVNGSPAGSGPSGASGFANDVAKGSGTGRANGGRENSLFSGDGGLTHSSKDPEPGERSASLFPETLGNGKIPNLTANPSVGTAPEKGPRAESETNSTPEVGKEPAPSRQPAASTPGPDKQPPTAQKPPAVASPSAEPANPPLGTGIPRGFGEVIRGIGEGVVGDSPAEPPRDSNGNPIIADGRDPGSNQPPTQRPPEREVPEQKPPETPGAGPGAEQGGETAIQKIADNLVNGKKVTPEMFMDGLAETAAADPTFAQTARGVLSAAFRDPESRAKLMETSTKIKDKAQQSVFVDIVDPELSGCDLDEPEGE